MIIFFIVGNIILRLIPHLPNFTSINALALVSGTKLNSKVNFLIPIITIALSDYLLLYISPFNSSLNFNHVYPLKAMFHSTTVYVWASLLISVLTGWIIKEHQSPYIYLISSIFISVQFFIITNFGVWATSKMYPPTLNGLIDCYIMGFSFFKWTLLGDMFYTTLFFSFFALSKNALSTSTKSV